MALIDLDSIYDDVAPDEGIKPKKKEATNLDSIYDEVADEGKKQAGTIAGIATQFNPEQIANSRNLGRQVGIPDDVAERNPEAVRRKFISQKVEELYDTSPVAGRKLADPSFAKLTHDITDELAGQEDAIKQLALTKKGFRAASELSRAMSDQNFSETINRAQNYTPDRGLQDVINSFSRSVVSGSTARVGQGLYGLMAAPVGVLAPFFDWTAGTVFPANPLRIAEQGWLELSGDAGNLAETISGDKEGQGFVERAVNSGFESLGMNLPPMLAGMFTGNPALALNAMVAITGGQEYTKAREQGLAPNSALAYAGTQAAVEWATEKIPVDTLFKGLREGKGVLSTLFVVNVQEQFGEQVAKVLQDLNEWAVLNKDKPFSAYLAERPEAAAQTAIATLIGTTGQVAIAKAIETSGNFVSSEQEKLNYQNQFAQESLQAFANIQKLAAESQLKQRSAQDFATFLQEAGGENGIDEVYVDARTLMEEAEKQGLDINTLMQSSPLINQQLEEAMRQGTDLIIPVGDFGISIAGTELGEALLPHLRAQEDAISAFEAQTQLDGAVEELQKQAEQVTQKYQDDETWSQEVTEVSANLESQLNAVGRFTPANNKAYVQGLVAPWYSTLASNLGITPAQAFARYPLKVSGNVTEDGLNQVGADQTQTPEFKAWAGTEEPVIEGNDINYTDFRDGKPHVLKLFHGTTNGFDTFDASVKGNKGGQFGAVNYFTSSEYDANENYLSSGPDITSRVEQESERLEWRIVEMVKEGGYETDRELHDAIISELANEFGLDSSSFDNYFEDNNAEEGIDVAAIANEVSRRNLQGGEEQVMEVYVRVNKPFVIGSQTAEPFIEFIDYSAFEEDAIESVAGSYGISVEEVKENYDQYEDEVSDERYTLAEQDGNPLINAIDEVAREYDLNSGDLQSAFYDLASEGSSHTNLEKILRNSDDLSYAEDSETGELVGHQVLASIIQKLGFDSIILHDANSRFASMDMESETTHVHIFDENNMQIKSATGNNGNFDRNDANIFNQDGQLQTNTPQFKAWFGDSKVVDADGKPLVVYHGTAEDFNTFNTNVKRKSTSSDSWLGDLGSWFSGESSNPNYDDGSDVYVAESFIEKDIGEFVDGGNVMPVYLSIKNPDIHLSYSTLQKAVKDAGGSVKYKESLINAGFDGVLIRGSTTDGGVVRDDYVAFEDTQIKSATGNNGNFDRNDANILNQSEIVDLGSLESAFKLATEGDYRTNRALKVDLQERMLAETERLGIDMSQQTPEVREILAKTGVKDALYALESNANAVGWYDKTVTKALDVLALIHPEIETDVDAKFAFTWALAVTSNGMKVDKNFELAEQAYNTYKKTGKMPTNVKAGQAQKAINDALKLFNTMKEKYGLEMMRDFMATEFKASQITRATGIKMSGENAGTIVRGAAVIGPKIGNGFFSNLNGLFDKLTMDRWLIRSWGRWTGSLIEDRPDMVESKYKELAKVIKSMTAKQKETFEADTRVDLSVTDPALLSKAINKASMDTKIRELMNKTAKGNDVRLIGNALHKYIDGQKEAPKNGNERNFIRSVFDDILIELRNEHGLTDLTMADLQALVWYPERRLYDAAKSSDEAEEGYEDDEAPDYANAAIALAKSQGISADTIKSRLASNSARAARSGNESDGSQTGQQERSSGFDERGKKNFLTRGIIHQFRSNRVRNGKTSAAYQGKSGKNGKSTRLLVGAEASQTFTVNQSFSNGLKMAGITQPKMFEVTQASSDVFYSQILELKNSNEFGATVDAYTVEEYAQMRLFLTDDGKAGFALNGDRIVSMFSGPEHQGAKQAMLQLAIDQGGRKIITFDTDLPDSYSVHGFKIASRKKWNDANAPEGWNKELYSEFNNGEPDFVFMVYDSNYFKNPTPNDGEYFESFDDVNVLNQSANPIFFSQLSKAFETAKQGTMPASQWAAWLNSNAAKLGVKKDEIQWTGITDWLELQGKEKVTKADIQAYLDGNGVQVEDVVLGQTERELTDEENQRLDYLTELNAKQPLGAIEDIEAGSFNELLTLENIRDKSSFDGLMAEQKRYQELAQRERDKTKADALWERSNHYTARAEELELSEDGEGGLADNTKFRQYTVEGGENYKELLLTLPNRANVDNKVRLSEIANEMDDGATSSERYAELHAERALLAENYTSVKNRTEYESSHFTQPNILAHVRFDERTDADGNKVLFINEIQSDWGQDGKKNGFRQEGEQQPRTTEDITAELDSRLTELGLEKKEAINSKDEVIVKLMDELGSGISARVIQSITGSVNKAPFVTDTKAWVSLATKRMMRYAVDNGFDKVAFINGQQAADLYDLSKQVESIFVEKVIGGTKDGQYFVEAKRDDGGLAFTKVVPENELEEVVGKDLATKIVEESTANKDGKSYSGLDLKVGGDGMRTFYDQIVPQAVNDVLKKVGGSKVGNVDLTGKESYSKYIIDAEDIGADKNFEQEVVIRDEKTMDGVVEPFNSIAAAEAWLDKNDVDTGTRNQIGFTITPEMREKISGGLALFQKARGQISFSNDIMQGANITLLKNADASTFIHELGHFFLEVYADIASKPDAPQVIVDDMNELLNWFGINDPNMEAIDAWRMMSLEDKREHHEKLARGFEQYALNGEAPTIGLAKAFAKFRQFMLSAYTSMEKFFKQTGDSALTQEVRQVFDRMLATDDAINQAQQVRGMMSLFASMEEAGMNVEEYAAYLADDEEATDEAKRQLDARSLRDLKWLRNARKGAIRDLQKEARVQRSIVRMQARRDVMSQPVYQAYAWLKQLPDVTGEEKKVKKQKSKGVDSEVDSLFTAIAKLGGLNREMATAEWGIDKEDQQSSGVFGKPVLRKEGGLSPDGMAELLSQYGYLTLDGNGKPDLTELEDKFFDEGRGDKQYSMAGEGVMFRAWQEAQLSEKELANLDSLGKGKLDLETMKALYTQEQISKLGVGRTGLVMTDGYSPDQVATLFGFTSGDHMAQALINAENPKDVIEAMTDERMTEQFADLVDDKAMQEAADKAVHNNMRARVLATEVAAQNKALGNRRVLEAAAKQYAEQIISATQVRDIKSGKYTRAESKSAKMAEKATRKGDTQTAVQAKRDQLLNNRTAKAAMDGIDEVEKAVKYLAKFYKESASKSIDIEYLEQIFDILQRFDLRTGQTLKAIGKRNSLVEWVEAQKELGLSPVIDEALLNEARRTSYKELTLQDFRALVDSVKNIEHLGRLKNKLLTAKDARDFKERMDEARLSINDNANRIVPERATPNDFIGKAGRFGRRMMAAHRKFSSFIRELDGGKDLGVMSDMLLYSMYEAGSLETELRAQATEDMQRLFATIEGSMDQGVANIYAIKRVVPGTNISLTHEQRIMFAMNWGNAGNRQRLLDGGLEGTRSISQEDAASILDTITKEEWDFIQGVWDYIATYKPLVAEQELKLTGREPAWIEATPIETKFGTYAGGYFPAKYDAQMSTRSESLEAAADLSMAMKGAFNIASARDGYTKARADAVKGRPILLSFDTITRHVHEVTHRLAWQEWLTDATRVLKALDGDIREKLGGEALQEMQQQIRDIANGDAPITGTTDIMLSRIRNGTSIVGMGYRVSTALLQPSGIFQTWARMGFAATSNGVKTVVSDPVKTHAWVMENSSMMRNRAKTLNREVNEIVNKVRTGGKIAAVQASYFFMITKMQMLIDLPTYVGAYEKALADMEYEKAGSEDERKAIETKAHSFAGQTVIDTQTGGEIKDLAGVQKGGQGQKLFTNFYSYFSALYNLNAENYRTKKLTDPTEFADFVATAILLNVMPVIYSVILKNILKGECDWNDTECLLQRYKSEQMSGIFGQMIGVRDIGVAVDVASGGTAYGYSGPPSLRFFKDIYSVGQQADKLIDTGEADVRLFKALNNAAGALLHYPSGQINTTIDGMIAIENGEVEGVNMFGALVSGPPRD